MEHYIPLDVAEGMLWTGLSFRTGWELLIFRGRNFLRTLTGLELELTQMVMYYRKEPSGRVMTTMSGRDRRSIL